MKDSTDHSVQPVPALTVDDLRERLDSASPPLLLDVMSEEDYATQRLPGARNACVYNVTFLDDVRKIAPYLNTPLVVYGSSSRNLASATAAHKLRLAGFTEVSDFRGGLEAWRAAGNFCDGDPASTPIPQKPVNGHHEIDLAKSRVEWTGRSLLGTHYGTVKLKSGHINMQDGLPADGSMVLDMRTIENADIADPEMREVLLHHLKSDDFFDVERFPEARFELTDITPLLDHTPGTPNAQVTGKLTLKGITQGVQFPAILAPTPEGVLAADAHFEIDRTLWNVVYGSGKFYEKLGKHLVNDTILIALKMITLPHP